MDKINLERRVTQIDAENLLPLIDLFVADHTKNVSVITVYNWRYQFSLLRRWWTEAGPATSWILTKDSFWEFMTWLEAQPNRQGKELSKNTINRTLKLTRQLLRWAFKNEHMASDISQWVPMSKRNVKTPARPMVELAELNRLFRAATPAAIAQSSPF